MSVDAVASAVERVRARDPELGEQAELVAEVLTAGAGLDMLSQSNVQDLLWWHMPRKLPVGNWAPMLAVAVALFDELGLDRYVAIAQAPRTGEILAAWAEQPETARQLARLAGEASGIEPPDTDLVLWGTVWGSHEVRARDGIERRLEAAIVAGELQPGGRGWKQHAVGLTDEYLTTPLDEALGQTPLGLVTTERVEAWIDDATGADHKRWRDQVSRHVLGPIPPPAELDSGGGVDAGRADGLAPPAPVVGPMRWLLEHCAAGAPLTQSHYLARPLVVEAAERFGWWPWDKPPRSEADLHQLFELREIATDLRLVRRRGRTLNATTKGRQLLDDQVALWRTLVKTLGGNAELARMVAEVIALRLLDGPAIDDDLRSAATTIVTAQGWRSRDGVAVEAATIEHVVHERLVWWRLLSLIDELRAHWDQATRRRVGHDVTTFTPAGAAAALAYLRTRATGPRSLIG